MHLQGMFIFALVALLVPALSAPMQNSWNPLQFLDSRESREDKYSHEDKSMEDYGMMDLRGARILSEDYDPRRRPEPYRAAPYGGDIYRSMTSFNNPVHGPSKRYGSPGSTSPGYYMMSVEDNSREYGRYSNGYGYGTNQRQQRPINKRQYDAINNKDNNLDAKHLYKLLSEGKAWGYHK
ncbi:unnamed protein product [Meganyctiphanes norvegica]|uniref:Uncharacterized protein n=1 Tax=Meganyctiphanes norvegica TaxID=48144 RepID=A0AAV2RLY7_MEGNR